MISFQAFKVIPHSHSNFGVLENNHTAN